jgi:hypothetical protein
MMKCKAMVLSRHYSPPGQCQQRNARLVRWAPTPLTTQIIKGLCAHHLKKLHAGTLTLIAKGR